MNWNTLNDLEPIHLHEIREMHMLAGNIATELKKYHYENGETSNNNQLTIKLGYHAIPSFEPLHLHIISSDLESPCVTKRDHIISFTSPLFFVSPASLERHLESAFANSLVLNIRKERAKSVKDDSPMTCPRCGRVAGSVPDWKMHNHSCYITAPKMENNILLNSLLGWKRKD